MPLSPLLRALVALRLPRGSEQARFFLAIDRLVRLRHRAYARRRLTSIVSWHRWGIAPAAGRHGFSVRLTLPAFSHPNAGLLQPGSPKLRRPGPPPKESS
jgi:hypothetical protein